MGELPGARAHVHWDHERLTRDLELGIENWVFVIAGPMLNKKFPIPNFQSQRVRFMAGGAAWKTGARPIAISPFDLTGRSATLRTSMDGACLCIF
jgi:hypothetical protein